jgi:glyoxylase-like metal-dependent hydrolase (beta-lactamase superfamily II)
MAYEYRQRADNVYLIDTMMFGFKWFNAAYIVAGEELALIDTGVATSIDAVRAAIAGHGFSVKDFDHIFVTHAEHPDHSGNAGILLQENDKATVYVSPVGAEYLTNPEIEAATRRVNLSAEMAARFGEMVPVPPSRIKYVSDGDVIDLGGGERLRVVEAPGHQPSGIVILAEKHNGLLINDLNGQYFADADFSMTLTPFRMDIRQSMDSLKKAMKLPAARLFLGHFGICDNPSMVYERALADMQEMLDIAEGCLAEGKPEEISARILACDIPKVEKLCKTRGQELYDYLSKELLPSKAKAFSNYYLGK